MLISSFNFGLIKSILFLLSYQNAVERYLEKISDKVFFICAKIFEQNYENVNKICDELIYQQSNNPLGYLFKAASLITKSIDYEDELEYNEVEKLLKKADELSTDVNYFSIKVLEGLTNSFKAYAEYQIGDYLSAFISGYRATHYFSKELEKNTDSPEALIAIGIYKYWSSKKSEYLYWLPFINDERKKE